MFTARPKNFIFNPLLEGAVKSGNFLFALTGIKLFCNLRVFFNLLQNAERKNYTSK